jgi:hypothetical protein
MTPVSQVPKRRTSEEWKASGEPVEPGQDRTTPEQREKFPPGTEVEIQPYTDQEAKWVGRKFKVKRHVKESGLVCVWDDTATAHVHWQSLKCV